MGRSRGVRRVARLIPALLALPLAAQPGADASRLDRRPSVECDDVAFAPAFAEEGEGVCYHAVRESGDTTGFELRRTTDQGRSWSEVEAVGLPANPDDTLEWIAFSPAYARDHAVY